MANMTKGQNMEVRVYTVKVEMNLGGARCEITAEVPAVPGEVDAFRTLIEGLNVVGDPVTMKVSL
jgi:hypothetical protein